MAKTRICGAPSSNGIKDPVGYAQYLDRMATQKRRVFHDGKWWNDPQQLKQALGLG